MENFFCEEIEDYLFNDQDSLDSFLSIFTEPEQDDSANQSSFRARSESSATVLEEQLPTRTPQEYLNQPAGSTEPELFCEQLTSSTPVEYLDKHTTSTVTETSSNTSRFCTVKSDREVELARKTGIPQKTKEDAKYCMGIWEDWCSYRRRANGDLIQPLLQLGSEDLQYWMTRFILEVR